MKPAPTTTTTRSGRRRGRRAARGSRRACAARARPSSIGAPGSRRATAPVAMHEAVEADARRRRRAARCGRRGRGPWRRRRAASRGRGPRLAAGSAMRSASHVAGQHLLRQRRPVVGRVWLGADDGDAPVVALVAQRLRGVHPGQRRADDRRSEPTRRTRLSPRRCEMACFGQRCTASSTLARSSSGGFSCRT